MLWALLFAAFLQSGAATSDGWQAEGLKALDEKRYEAALETFAKAVAANPKDYAAHFHLALASSMLNRDEEAVRQYRETLELKPGLYEAELNLGILLLRDKQAGDAAPLLQKAAASKPSEFRPQYYLAEALLASGQNEPATEAFQKALKLDGKSAAAEAGLARSLASAKQVDDAAAHFRRAAELDPAYRDALLELANLYEQAGRKDDAAKLYAEFPENAAAQERAGTLRLEAGNAEGAIPSLEAAVKSSPTTANRVALVQAYLHAKQNDKAFALLVTAVRADPKNFDLRMLAGRMLRDQRKFPEAANQFMGAAQIKPDAVEAWNELSSALILGEKYPEALAALDRVKALGAETAAHHYFRAIVLDKLHQLQPAFDSYRKFLEMDNGQRPDEEFKARQRARILQRELSKK